MSTLRGVLIVPISEKGKRLGNIQIPFMRLPMPHEDVRLLISSEVTVQVLSVSLTIDAGAIISCREKVKHSIDDAFLQNWDEKRGLWIYPKTIDFSSCVCD